MNNKYDSDDDDFEDIICPKYDPSEYELRIDHLLEAYHDDLSIKITTFYGEIIQGTILFVYPHETRVCIHSEDKVIEKTIPISEIRYTEITKLKKTKKG